MRQAASDACIFLEGLGKDDFIADKRSQRAVVMSLIIIGEAASKILERYPDFAERHAEIQWHGMKGMRNRIAHGYFDINLDVVWDTVGTALPLLLRQLSHIEKD
nr:HepT-like ribonuclease domain-containing protein [Beijerinckia sp. L45]